MDIFKAINELHSDVQLFKSSSYSVNLSYFLKIFYNKFM